MAHWQTKRDGQALSKRAHMCTACRHSQPENWQNAPCPACGMSGTRQYFGSAIELNRGAALLLALNLGQITDLKFQPRFDIVVEGEKICTYVADSSYRRDGKYIVEDVKPLRFMDGEAKLKIALFNALNKKHGITVSLYKKGS